MKAILIVEDDQALNKGIELALAQPEYTFFSAFDLGKARDVLKSHPIDLIILDINLPDGNGLDFCKELRTYSNIPIIFLTANKEETDIVTGFYVGGDDYVTKPFSLMVLRARVMAALKHSEQIKSHRFISKDEQYCFDFDNMVFKKDKCEIVISKTEQKLLRLLVMNKGMILSRERLVDAIWVDGSEYVDETALTVTISRLRHKLEDIPGEPHHIKTIYGLGYMWCDE